MSELSPNPPEPRINELSVLSPDPLRPVTVDAETNEHHKFIDELVARRLIDYPEPVPGLPGTEHNGRMLVETVIGALSRQDGAPWAVATVESAISAIGNCPKASALRQQVRHYTGIALFSTLCEMKKV